MERFVKGDVVVLPFPYSDLSASKKRPALVLADLKGDDIILCQITSQMLKDGYAIPFGPSDFKKGSLNKQGHIRPNRLFTADKAIILRTAGTIEAELFQRVTDKLFGSLPSTSSATLQYPPYAQHPVVEPAENTARLSPVASTSSATVKYPADAQRP